MNDDRLIAQLRDLREPLFETEVPDLSQKVIAAIESKEAPSLLRRPILVTAAAVVAILIGTVSVPTARRAVADLLGLDGVKITVTDDLPEGVAGDDLRLGTRTTLAELGSVVDWEPALPGALGAPDAVYVQRNPVDRVSFVYLPSAEFPGSEETGVGLLFSQHRANYVQDLSLKMVHALRGRVRPVEVAGAEAYWISGGPHLLIYQDASGNPIEDEGRLAGNTLLWQRDGIVYRLEGDLPRERALEIANSVHD